jgi:hypothetical protein
MKKIIEWFKASNRIQHLGLGFAYGLAADDWYCAIYGGAGVSGALEFKDYQWGGKPDWVDFILTFAGVMAGYGARLGFIATL